MKSTLSRLPLIGWCLFDVANSSYTTLIITVAFNVVFTKLIVGPDVHGSFAWGNALWAWVLSASWLVTALSGPILGAISDAHALRKRFLMASVVLCGGGSVALYFVEPGMVLPALLAIALSNIGFSLSENFVSAFLPSIAATKDMGRISGLAWGLGYFGGLGSILLAQSLTGLDYRIENYDRLRLIGPLTAAFFAVGSLPALLWLREPRKTESKTSFDSLRQMVERLRRLPDLSLVLCSCFCFQGAIGIVISFAAIYAEQVIGLSGGWQAAFFIVLQLTAAGGAFAFGWLQNRWGGLKTLNATLYLWLVTLGLIYGTQPLAASLGIDVRVVFLAVGNLAGLGLGATQACGRALVGQMAPKGRSGEVFGLWGLAMKLAMVFSLFVFGWIQKAIGLEAALLFCMVLFLGSIVIHQFIDEQRGRRMSE